MIKELIQELERKMEKEQGCIDLASASENIYKVIQVLKELEKRVDILEKDKEDDFGL